MQENDFSFVSIDTDGEVPLLSDAVVLDVEGDDGILDAVMLEDAPADGNDFITLSDDVVTMSDMDESIDDYISIDIDGSDISFII